MKTFLLFLTGLIGAVGHAQSIVFPDANFKAALLSPYTHAYTTETGGSPVAIDVNTNGEIEVSEALLVKRLSFDLFTSFENGAGIGQFANLIELTLHGTETYYMDMTGLVNLKKFTIFTNQFNDLDFSPLVNLEEVYIMHCMALDEIDLSANHNLKKIVCYGNTLDALLLSPTADLTYLDCDNNELESIDVTPYENLTYLDCSGNLLTSLDLSGQSQLTHLNCCFNLLPDLVVSGQPNLQELYCNNNLLTALDVGNLSQLKNLEISATNISTINLAALPNLQGLVCDATLIPTLDTAPLTQLVGLVCGGTALSAFTYPPTLKTLHVYHAPQITAVDLSNVPLLESFALVGTSLTSVDVSLCPLLNDVYLNRNEVLEYANIKNGRIMSWVTITDCPELMMVCAEGYPTLQENLSDPIYANNPYIQVNSYCSFTPGGGYNTLSGDIRFDNEGDGCDGNDVTYPYLKVNITHGSDSAITHADGNGHYNFYVQSGDFTITPQMENPDYFTLTPASAVVNFASVDQLIEARNFCITANGIHPEAEISIVPLGSARPGFDADYELVYRNTGNQTVSGNIVLNFDDARTDLLSADPAPNAQSFASLSWNFANLAPFETRSVHFTINLNGPMEIPPLNDGDILDFAADLNYQTDAGNYLAETELHHIIVNSLDPNDKTCLEGNTISPEMIGHYVHYNINFENIGTAEAINIVVKDVIDAAKFDVSTLQVISASHAVVTRIDGNKVEFIFENINLPGTAGDNKGNVLFKIKTWPTLVLGDVISNKADIFFDYNFPIQTNEASSTFSVLKSKDFVIDATIGIEPNPVKDKVRIKADNNIKSVQLFDWQGRILQSSVENKNESSMDISGKSNGVYFLRITTEKGSKTEKIIKE